MCECEHTLTMEDVGRCHRDGDKAASLHEGKTLLKSGQKAGQTDTRCPGRMAVPRTPAGLPQRPHHALGESVPPQRKAF